MKQLVKQDTNLVSWNLARNVQRQGRKERERGRAGKENSVYDYTILVNTNVIDLIDANYITIPTNQGKKTRECFE